MEDRRTFDKLAADAEQLAKSIDEQLAQLESFTGAELYVSRAELEAALEPVQRSIVAIPPCGLRA